ncbi:MAG: MotA/TolQ/ExbB proton channel family protein [Epsilonproteobacteria bacterium]|nr:MotA/TolQ/ExbB proton channel family protein [Campylobacterota bacterium]
MDIFLSYITEGGIIATLVFIWLSLYFLITIWIWVSRYLTLNSWEKSEKSSLESLLRGVPKIKRSSILSKCLQSEDSKASLNICKSVAEKKATSYLSMLSVISSTAPFIGLFGTIVSILKTFAELGNAKTASLTVIAPAISEALVVTAAGIFVAIPAYSAHVLLKRKAYELLSVIEREIELLHTSSPRQESGTRKNEF